MNDRATRAIVPHSKPGHPDRMNGAVFVPDRRVLEELMDGQRGVFERLGGGLGAACDRLDCFRVQVQDRLLPILRV